MAQGELSVSVPESYQADPFNDIAWQSFSATGRMQLLFSWEARDALGIDPVKPVLSYDSSSEFLDRYRSGMLPGFLLVVVGPAELSRVVEDLSDGAVSKTEVDHAIGHKLGSHIFGAVGLSITRYDEPTDQVEYLRKMYGDNWDDYAGYLHRPDGFQYLIKHLLPHMVKQMVLTGAISYLESGDTRDFNPVKGRMITSEYSARIANAVHETFCTDEHTPVTTASSD